MHQAQHDGITLSLDASTDLDNLYVYLDEYKFGQVITNLIGNAFKFTSRGGFITVSVTHVDAQEKVVINITDTGVGIAQVIFISQFAMNKKYLRRLYRRKI